MYGLKPVPFTRKPIPIKLTRSCELNRRAAGEHPVDCERNGRDRRSGAGCLRRLLRAVQPVGAVVSTPRPTGPAAVCGLRVAAGGGSAGAAWDQREWAGIGAGAEQHPGGARSGWSEGAVAGSFDGGAGDDGGVATAMAGCWGGAGMDSAAASRPGIPADCSLALPDLGAL